MSEIIEAGRAEQRRLVTGSRENLLMWFRQSDRLRLLKSGHGLRGDALMQAARQMDIDKSTAYSLVKLSREKANEILAKCDNEANTDPTFVYPGIRKVFDMSRIGINSLMFNSRGDEHPTPWPIVKAFAPSIGFDLDVAATSENAKAERFFTKEQDGLAQPWHGEVWLNPPYSDVSSWIRKAHEVAETGNATVTALLPVRTDMNWFADYVSQSEITFLTGRVTFEGSGWKAPFASMVCRFTGKTKRKMDVRVIPTPT